MRKYYTQALPHVEAVNPLVLWVWQRINDLKLSHVDVAKTAGISASTMRRWRKGHEPRLGDLVRVIDTLGGELTITLRKDIAE